MTEIYELAIKKLKEKDSLSKEKTENPSDLLTREEILKKIKTINETLKKCKKKRLKVFYSPRALKSMLLPTVPTKLRKEQRKSSQIISSKTIDFGADSSQNSNFEESNSIISSETDSESSEKNTLQHFPKIELVFDTNFSELAAATEDLNLIDAEFADKFKPKVKSRVSQSILPGDLSIYSLTSCRSYIKISKEAYEGEDLEFSRNYVALSLESLQIFQTARERTPEIIVNISDIKEIIDPKDGKIKIVYVYKFISKGIVVWPITSADYNKWSNVLKNVSKIKSIYYKTDGTLPSRVEEEPSPLIRHKNTIYQRTSILSGDKLIQTIQESVENSLETDKSIIEDSSEQSWDFNFEELEKEKSLKGQNDDFSMISEDHNPLDEEKIRSLTVLANLGKSEGLVNLLTKGGLFLKYGRWGKPHLRHILVTADLKFVEWWKLNQNKASGNMFVVNISGIQAGRNTKNFKRFKETDKDHISFSLLCKARTIDLELGKDNKTPVEVWIMAFEHLIKHQFKKDQVVRYIAKNSTIKE